MEALMKRLMLLILLIMLTLAAAGAQALDQSQDEIPITRSDITADKNPTPWPTPYPDSSLHPPDDCPVTRRPEARSAKPPKRCGITNIETTTKCLLVIINPF
jgi:hypothetical protein